MLRLAVMARLVPAIHAAPFTGQSGAFRWPDKPGHDGVGFFILVLAPAEVLIRFGLIILYI
jgi:hypothetical protein